MIFFLAGTSDARALALQLQAAGYPLLVSVVTEHAAEGLRTAGLEVRHGRLDQAAMTALLRNLGARLVVDASHPFAEEAHRNAAAAAQACGVPYLRYERPASELAAEGVLWVDTYEQAAEVAATRRGSVMLTTGSKTLPVFARRLVGLPGTRLVVRLLPRRDNLELCEQLGIEQRNIIAMQGPFSYDLNVALYKHYGTTLMITKESGSGPGAVDEKVRAAVDLGVDVVVIGRPARPPGVCVSDTAGLLAAVQQLWRGKEGGCDAVVPTGYDAAGRD
ncbi:MAG: precorrin-6A reductase [Alicyclobacillus sp.]|nr:precorrin-6A reductase [Alicyclobacillus sp.]